MSCCSPDATLPGNAQSERRPEGSRKSCGKPSLTAPQGSVLSAEGRE